MLWLFGGLIAGGSGIVSTAATKRKKQINHTEYLCFNAPSSLWCYPPGGRPPLPEVHILHYEPKKTESFVTTESIRASPDRLAFPYGPDFLCLADR